MLLGGCIIGVRCIYPVLKQTQVKEFPVDPNLCPPLSVKPTYTLESRRIVSAQPLVAEVLCASRKPKVVPLIVEPVQVLMVYIHPVWRVHDEAVHPHNPTVFSTHRIPTADPPTHLRKTLEVSVVNERDLATR
jgi:hypothetical protein